LETSPDVLVFPMCDGTYWRVFVALKEKQTIETYNSMDVSANDGLEEVISSKKYDKQITNEIDAFEFSCRLSLTF